MGTKSGITRDDGIPGIETMCINVQKCNCPTAVIVVSSTCWYEVRLARFRSTQRGVGMEFAGA